MPTRNLKPIVDSFTRTSSKKKVIVSDLDEVLVDSVPVWVWMVLKKNGVEDIIPPAVSDFEFLDLLRNRLDYFVTPFIKGMLGKVEATEKEIADVYNAHPDFYADLSPTKIGCALSYTDSVSHLNNTQLHILSHYPESETENLITESKKRFVERNFPNAVFHQIPMTQSKGEYIRDNIPDVATFIDDRLDIVKDFLKKVNPVGVEILMPTFGYNEPDDEILELVHKTSSRYLRFDQLKNYDRNS